MCLLFSFVNPDRPHGTLLAGYFSKVHTILAKSWFYPSCDDNECWNVIMNLLQVVICLLMRKPVAVMLYLQVQMFI
jgi:hypothetical protein